jgi:shikimate kinase
MNIVLIGYRGAGKSTVGKRLAERLKMRFVDIDDLVEKSQGASIREIVESLGWEHFRTMEKAAIQEISRKNGFVIAPGGGGVLDPENARSLKDSGLVVWLKAEPEVLAERMKSDPQTISSRPTLTGKGALAEIREVMSSRDSIYKKVATLELDTSALDVEAVVERVVSLIPTGLEA